MKLTQIQERKIAEQFGEYQKLCKTTAVYPDESGIEYTALGLCGEAGEVANEIKKYIRGDYNQNEKTLHDLKVLLFSELGDVLWYAAMLASELDVNLGAIAVGNIAKLRSRKERGVLKGSGGDR